MKTEAEIIRALELCGGSFGAIDGQGRPQDKIAAAIAGDTLKWVLGYPSTIERVLAQMEAAVAPKKGMLEQEQ